MCLVKFNVFISEIGDGCHIIDPPDGEEWFVHVVDCEGKVLKFCGKEFRDIPAKCGHAEFEAPPGCYMVFASHSKKGEGVPPFGNRLTHVQIVRANCGEDVCVTLFSPSLWYCGTWFNAAVRQQVAGLARAGADERITANAIAAVDALLERVKPDRFAENLQAFQERPDNKKR